MWQRFTFSFKVTCVQELLKTNPVQSWSVSGRSVPSTTKCRLLLTLDSAGYRQQGSYRSLGHVWIVCLVIVRNPFSPFIGTFHIWVTQQVATGPFPPRTRREKPLNRRTSDGVRAPPCLLCIASINEGPFSSEAGRRSEVSCVDPKTSPLRVCKSVWTTSFKASRNIQPKSLREKQALPSPNSPLTFEFCTKIEWLLIGPFPTDPIIAALHPDHSSLFRWKVALAQGDGDQAEGKWSWDPFLLWRDIVWGTYWIKHCISSQKRRLERLLFGKTSNVGPGPPRDVTGLHFCEWMQLAGVSTKHPVWNKSRRKQRFPCWYKLYKRVSASIIDDRPVRISDARGAWGSQLDQDQHLIPQNLFIFTRVMEHIWWHPNWWLPAFVCRLVSVLNEPLRFKRIYWQQSIKCLYGDWLLFYYSWKSCSARWTRDEVWRARFNCSQSLVIRSKARLWFWGSRTSTLTSTLPFSCWTANLLIVSLDDAPGGRYRTFLLSVCSPATCCRPTPPQRDAATISLDCWDRQFVMKCSVWCGPKSSFCLTADVPVDLWVFHTSPLSFSSPASQSHLLKLLSASEGPWVRWCVFRVFNATPADILEP